MIHIANGNGKEDAGMPCPQHKRRTVSPTPAGTLPYTSQAQQAVHRGAVREGAGQLAGQQPGARPQVAARAGQAQARQPEEVELRGGKGRGRRRAIGNAASPNRGSGVERSGAERCGATVGAGPPRRGAEAPQGPGPLIRVLRRLPQRINSLGPGRERRGGGTKWS